MKAASEVVACCWDQGLFPELAMKLGKTFKKVYYYVPWQRVAPKLNVGWIGKGLEGIEVIESPWGPQFDEIDLHIFPDVNFGHEQVYLESIGKKVWGSRMGEELELCRECTKKWMKSQGLDVGKYAVVKGVEALREYLKSHKKQHVKVNRWRGTFESFRSDNYELVEPVLDELDYKLGAFRDVLEFIVEDDLPDMVEIGVDAWFVENQQPSSVFCGIEVKDEAFIGVFKEYTALPEPLTRFNDKVAPLMKKFGYRGFFSSEVRIDKKHNSYLIDACCRAASPPNELYQELYTNLAEIIWQGAHGIMVEPIPLAKYGALIVIESSWADNDWQPFSIPKELRQFVKLKFATKISGREYAIPQNVGMTLPGAVVGWGDTVDEAISECLKHAEGIKGQFICIPPEALDKAKEQIDVCNEYGLDIF